ncbi:unnamed protein product [Miscanthus lutarioriparius]|uniref:Large ribosomal subunit protein uL4m n=1 Tax=Miscanthus lutarioriparius TaxID=422564 RepID=A0A811QPR7_9POAL|nr:unnamed protein product [Miscanthus lutarioriparius]
MRALARAASLLRHAAVSAPTTGALHHPPLGVGSCLAKVWTPLSSPSPVLGAAVRRRLALHGGAGGGLSLLAASNLLGFFFNGYSTLLAPQSEVLIPPELLSSRTVWTPDRELGQYEDLVARVTNFHNEDKGFMVLDGDVFDVPIRKDIVHWVVRWQLAKRQQGTHSTKTISEFRGGATMHGPKPRSHAIKLQKKVRRLGLKIALSARTAEGKLLVFEDLEVPSHKTKNIVQYISQMDDTKKVLLVDGGDIDKKLKLATQNLHYVNVLPSTGLNVYSILQHDTLVMTRAAINRIVERMHTPINR